jgi:F0F1-type ATP synthase gamma subunit
MTEEELTPVLTVTSESRPPSEMTQEDYQQQQRDLAAVKASADAYETQQAIYAAENAARWEAMRAALANCEREMRQREGEYQTAMGHNRPPAGDA